MGVYSKIERVSLDKYISLDTLLNSQFKIILLTIVKGQNECIKFKLVEVNTNEYSHTIAWSELVLLYSWTLIKVNVIKNLSIHLAVIFIRMKIRIRFDGYVQQFSITCDFMT